MEGEAAVREGQVLAGKFRLIERLGAGGMGEVWRAHHQTLDAEVAIKVLHPELARREQTRERFLREAKAGAKLRSPHVVQILDYGIDDDVPFIAMELLEGESLAQRLDREGTLGPELTRLVMTHVGRAVARAHEAGIVHRDLKPDNVFLVDNDGEIVAKVLDFGVVKRTVEELADGATASVQTATGAMLGTPYYMSPEQLVSGGAIDHRTDLWALGVVAYQCVCGARPFGGATIGDVVLSVCSQPAPVPSKQTTVPAGFDRWFAKATHRELSERFDSAREMADELGTILDPSGAPPDRVVVAVADGSGARVSSQADTEVPGQDVAQSEPVAATQPAAVAGPPAPAGQTDRYLVQKEGEVHKYKKAKLLKELRKNDLSGLELVRCEDEEEWQPLYQTELFRREVPHRGDPRDVARWRQLRDFGAHFLIWAVLCVVVGFSWSGGFDWWKWLWGAFVALHGIQVSPTALALYREGKLWPWKRQKGQGAARTGAAELASSAPGAKASTDGSSSAAPLAEQIERLRGLLGKEAGQAAAKLVERMEQLATSAAQLARQEAALESELADSRAEDLEQAERRARIAVDEATTDPERAIRNEELDAIAERRNAMDGARRALEQLRARRGVAAHQLEQLRLDLASAEAKALRLPDLSTRIDEIRIEAEARQEVEEALAEPRVKRR